MGIGTTAAVVGGSLAGSVGSAVIGANAAGNAASVQSSDALKAAGIQQSDANAATAFNEQQLNLAQQNTAPTRAVGQNATIALNDLMGLTPVNPYPINAGGNVAPQAAGISGQATPGYIAGSPGGAPGGVYPNGLPSTAVNPAYPGAPQAPIPRAKGGPTKIGLHYLVGERGPEELVMHPDGSGHILPHPVHSNLIPRMQGGQVGNVIPGVQTATGQVPNGPAASTGGMPAKPPSQGPYTAGGSTVNASGNPLVTGGNAPGSTSQLNPFQSWVMPFQAPTAAQAAQYPGYQFQLQQGEQALGNQASATGEGGDSNYGRALANYGEQAAQSDYGNVYNQALQQYQQAYNIFNNNQTNQFNRLSSLAGGGQTATNQLNSLGGQAAGNVSNTLLNSGAQVGQQLNNAGAATASGYVGAANAYGGALNNVSSNLGQYLTLQQILGQQGGGGADFNPNMDTAAYSNF